jgi:hypothetical protein
LSFRALVSGPFFAMSPAWVGLVKNNPLEQKRLKFKGNRAAVGSISFKSVLLNTGSPGLDKEKGAGGMIFGRRSGVKIIREAAFDAV